MSGKTGSISKTAIAFCKKPISIWLDSPPFSGQPPIFQSEYRFLTKDGSRMWMLDRGKVIERNADGGALRMLGTHVDVTERWQLWCNCR
ncbi:MAG: hypothetical protein Fur0046_29600 [Cyanobacteria bacterium J069]